MKFTTIKRRFFGKGFQVFKRLVIPSCLLFILFNFLTSSPSSKDAANFPPDEDNMVVPGEALDPIIRKTNFNKKYDSHTEEKEKKISDSYHSNLLKKASIKDATLKPSVLEREEEHLNTPEVHHKESKTTKYKHVSSGSPKSFDDSDIPARMETAWSMAKANIPDMDKVRFKGHAITNDTVTLTLMSSADKVFISLNKKEIYRGIEQRGLHVVVLNQYNGRVMAKRVFDTFQKGVEEDFVEFIDDITPGRIIVLAVEDEIATGLSWKGRNKLKELGCRFADRIAYRDMWAMVTRKDGLKIAETFSNVATADTGYEWGGPIFMRTDFDLEERPVECDWPYNERNHARRLFCVRYEGYGRLCRCDVPNWDDVFFKVDKKVHQQLSSNPLHKDLGIIILATNRPHSLYKTLKSLHEAPGFNKDLTAIYVETATREVVNLAKLFGITLVETPKFKNISIPAKIRRKMQRVFRDIIGAKFDPKVVPEGVLPDDVITPFSVNNILVLEEDIFVAIDIFMYLYAMYPILKRDQTVLGISAFNYHGYRDVAESQTNSFRTTHPQVLALLLPSRTVHDILVPNWPLVQNAEDDWFEGLVTVMKGDQSIVYPEIPRAKHSSYEGFLVSGVAQAELFKNHLLSTTLNYEISNKEIDRLVLQNYENEMRNALKESEALVFDFCEHDLLYGSIPYSLYVNYDIKNDTNWSYVMKCLNTWYLFPLGGWKGVWQFHYHGHALYIVGVPASPYSSFNPDKNPLVTAPPSSTTKATTTLSTKKT